MDLLLAFIVGAVVGVAIAYGFSRNQLTLNEGERAFELKKVREELERTHESRLQAAIQAARDDYETHLAQRETELKQAHNAELETRLAALQSEHQQELETRLAALRSEHQQELETRLAALRSEHQQELETRLAALQSEHQQELERATASLPEPSPTSTLEDLAIAVPPFEDFEGLLEPVEDDPELEASATSEESPSLASPTAIAESPVLPNVESELIATPPFNPPEADIQPVLEPEMVQERIIPTVPQSTLEETITALANPVHLKAYLRSPSHQARAALAAALGKIVRGQPMRAGVSQAVETLAVLARDRSPAVRQAAVEAIATVKSDSIIPLLQQALRDPDRNVVKAASAGMARFKFYPSKRPSQLPFNAAQKRGR